ncbi:UPF0280 family protein [Albimonas sp. CAU 1670]|uniref:UPF0280 family protein n=1 Tax=Albimonas sp. CAU 1670 TaxID=3032599 RepID=UPI0023DB67EC|nr:UPF0280 family protein [Albimonas sp. CAU 1670]MDF2234704.1 UPF0280 family protein [Albimonas sp. CAU 1670]
MSGPVGDEAQPHVPRGFGTQTSGPQGRMLPDGRRLHLHHGPIDLVIEADGDDAEAEAALLQAARRFDGLLEELVAELPLLRAPLDPAAPPPLEGAVARRMLAATLPFATGFVTPMAAVAGAVADEVLAAMTRGRTLRKAYVNDGGDVALHVAPGEELVAALAVGERARNAGSAVVRHGDPTRGIATSGRGGRSLSMGVAEAVTVLAPNAALADAAATLIANAVDLPGHPAVRRGPACDEDPDSDLGERLVTLAVGELPPEDAARALDAGLAVAEGFRARGLIQAAALFLQDETRVCGPLSSAEID